MNATPVSKCRIAGKIHEHTMKVKELFILKAEVRDIKVEAMTLAVDLGMTQERAMNGEAALDFLDGYLAGAGSLPAARVNPKPLSQEAR